MEPEINTVAPQENIQQSSAPAPHKYGIFQSLQELLGAIKRNPLTFIIAIIVSYVLATAVLIATVVAMTSLLLGSFGLLFASFGKIITFLVVGLIVYTLLYSLVYAFTLSSMAFALDGSTNGVRMVLKKALLVTPRIAKVNAWVAVIAYWPIALAAFLPLLLLAGARTGGSSFAVLTPVLVIAALVWSIIAQLRYALAPYVAMFEPDVPVKQTLKRSQELLSHGGQWFIVKGFLLLLGIFILIAILTKSSFNQLQSTDNIAINIILIILSILVEGALVMLYLNRSQKSDPAFAPKSPRLLLVVAAVLIGLFGLAAAQAHSLSHPSDAALAKINKQTLKDFHDSISKASVADIADSLENYYKDYGFYPAVTDIANHDWAVKNLKHTYGNTTQPILDGTLKDLEGRYINTPNSEYTYSASPDGCTHCASFVLTAKLKAGNVFTQESLNKTVKPVASATPPPATPIQTSSVPTQSQTPVPAAPVQQPANTSGKSGSVYELYKVAADGSSAQESPVTSTLSGLTSVALTVDLQCLGTCQFKLVSDSSNVNDTTTYTSSQKITYQITTPGDYIFYNQFTPNTKFRIKF